MNRTEKVELHVDHSKILFSVITQEWRTYLLQWRYGLLLCLHASSTLRLACVLWFYNFAVIYPPLPVFTISWLHVGICREIWILERFILLRWWEKLVAVDHSGTWPAGELNVQLYTFPRLIHYVHKNYSDYFSKAPIFFKFFFYTF